MTNRIKSIDRPASGRLPLVKMTYFVRSLLFLGLAVMSWSRLLMIWLHSACWGPLTGLSVSIQLRFTLRIRWLISSIAEHILELQTLKMWYEDASNGLLSDGTSNPAGPIVAQFFENTVINLDVRLLQTNTPGLASGGAALWKVEERLFNALGSTPNDKVFVLAEDDINCYKTPVSVSQLLR